MKFVLEERNDLQLVLSSLMIGLHANMGVVRIKYGREIYLHGYFYTL